MLRTFGTMLIANGLTTELLQRLEFITPKEAKFIATQRRRQSISMARPTNAAPVGIESTVFDAIARHITNGVDQLKTILARFLYGLLVLSNTLEDRDQVIRENAGALCESTYRLFDAQLVYGRPTCPCCLGLIRFLTALW